MNQRHTLKVSQTLRSPVVVLTLLLGFKLNLDLKWTTKSKKLVSVPNSHSCQVCDNMENAKKQQHTHTQPG